MMGRSSRQEPKLGVEVDGGLGEPHVSGAYIRRLVKQLTTKEGIMMNSRNMEQQSDGGAENPQTPPLPSQPPQHKKQVRRRLHTSRPYQERLLNMAEARREIVTALKFHRAAMKQAQEQQQQQHEESPQKPSSPPPARIDPSRSNFSNYVDVVSPYSSFPCHQPNPLPLPPYHQPNPFTLPVSPVSPLPFTAESLSFTLPTHPPLGLNLNFHDFDILSENLYQSSNGNTSSSVYSSSSPSSSSSPAEEIPFFSSSAAIPQDQGLHQVMDDEEMAEIRSIGEQHQMEWNDTVNLMTSAWWCKFLKGVEVGPEEMKAEDDGYQPFDEVMEFPAWLNTPDSSLQQHLDDCFSKDYFLDPALPCMDIGEIEGIDGEWLS